MTTMRELTEKVKLLEKRVQELEQRSGCPFYYPSQPSVPMRPQPIEWPHIPEPTWEQPPARRWVLTPGHPLAPDFWQ